MLDASAAAAQAANDTSALIASPIAFVMLIAALYMPFVTLLLRFRQVFARCSGHESSEDEGEGPSNDVAGTDG